MNKSKNSENLTNSSQSNNNFFNPKSEKLEISYFQYYISCFRDEISKLYNKLLKKGLGQIDQVLDISYITHKLFEIDMLKLILMDEDQLNLFDQIPKPTLSMKEIMNKRGLVLHKKFNQNYHRNSILTKKSFEPFELISSRAEKTKLDEKLLEMIPNAAKNQQKINSISQPRENFKIQDQELKEMQGRSFNSEILKKNGNEFENIRKNLSFSKEKNFHK